MTKLGCFRETEQIGCRVEREIHFKELAHMILVTGESRALQARGPIKG